MPSFFFLVQFRSKLFFCLTKENTIHEKIPQEKKNNKKKTLSLWLFIAKEMTHIYCKHKYLLVIIGAKKEHPTFMDVVHTLVRLK